ncbi:MAG: HAD family hydrolase [Beijerinckiaceae bacterium]|nr:HAD family hydrolase [Beijerinckiaceae bacterium]
MSTSSFQHLLRSEGLWAEIRRPVEAGRSALFLDRDGAVVEERHYLRSVADVALTQGAGEAIARLNLQGVPIVLITNQAGVGRDIFTWDNFMAVQDEMHRQLARHGAAIDAVYACAYHEHGKAGYAVANHPWRKPNPGMIEAARTDLGADLGRSWVIGDRATDLQAGRAAGLRGGTLVATGYGSDAAEIAAIGELSSDTFAISRAASLAEAIAEFPAGPWPAIRRAER